MAFVVAAAIGGGAALLGGYMSSEAAKDAANTQAGAMQQSSQIQQQIYNQQRADQQPWMQAGQSALSEMQNPYFQQSFSPQDFQQDPGYAFRMQQGQQAIERSAAARGGLNSGATMKALNNYAQGQASQEYQSAYDRFNNDRSQRFGRLATVAGYGIGANNSNNASGSNYANGMSNSLSGMANAQAAGQVGQANAYSGALGTVGNTAMSYSMMNRMYPPKTPDPTAGGAVGAVNPEMFGTNRYAGSLTGGME